MSKIGHVCELWQYPVKSMAGEQIAQAQVGWHGLEQDRRYALLRSQNQSGFPWLTASRLPQLLGYQPHLGATPMVTTPAGEQLELFGEALKAEVSAAFGEPVQVVRLDQGIFDEAPISIITAQSIRTLGEHLGFELDSRRFRPNLILEVNQSGFPEDGWVGKTLQVGQARFRIALRDVRCVMVNFDPQTLESDPRVLKATAQYNQVCLGVYAYVEQPGRVAMNDEALLLE